ncbi:unnamed protein product, partial [marine sediment metagenome]
MERRVSQCGLLFTFTLNTTYSCGQFVDGTFWVIDPGGGVGVSAISPAYSGQRHGYMVNNNGGRIPWVQSLDSRLNVGGWNPVTFTAPPALSPLILTPGDVLFKIESTSYSACLGNNSVTCIKDNTALTVLGVDPTIACDEPFRPTWNGNSRTIYCWDDVDIAAQ